jgi:hypothetical protein
MLLILSTWSAAPPAREIVRSCARVRGGAHGQIPGGEGAPGQGKEQRKEELEEVRGEEGETKEVTLATAFSEHFFFLEKRDTVECPSRAGDRRRFPLRSTTSWRASLDYEKASLSNVVQTRATQCLANTSTLTIEKDKTLTSLDRSAACAAQTCARPVL